MFYLPLTTLMYENHFGTLIGCGVTLLAISMYGTGVGVIDSRYRYSKLHNITPITEYHGSEISVRVFLF